VDQHASLPPTFPWAKAKWRCEAYHYLAHAVSEDLPEQVYQLMDLYPQAADQQPSVSYIPMPYHREGEQTVGGLSPPTGRRRRA
jgi:hypothetical protein